MGTYIVTFPVPFMFMVINPVQSSPNVYQHFHFYFSTRPVMILLEKVSFEHLLGEICDQSSHIFTVEETTDYIDALPIDSYPEFSIKVVFRYDFFIYDG